MSIARIAIYVKNFLNILSIYLREKESTSKHACTQVPVWGGAEKENPC